VITPALGLRVKAENGGLLITEVLPLSPAYHAGLEVGDTLLEINGVPIRTEQQYSEAVDTSSPTMRLKVRDHRRPQVAEVKAMLNQ
jgi:predicted metalloprotease with PDZ domain